MNRRVKAYLAGLLAAGGMMAGCVQQNTKEPVKETEEQGYSQPAETSYKNTQDIIASIIPTTMANFSSVASSNIAASTSTAETSSVSGSSQPQFCCLWFCGNNINLNMGIEIAVIIC